MYMMPAEFRYMIASAYLIMSSVNMLFIKNMLPIDILDMKGRYSFHHFDLFGSPSNSES